MRRRGFGTILAGLGGALLLIFLNESTAGQYLWAQLVASLSGELGMGALELSAAFGAYLTLGSLATIGVVVARAVASARVRDGKPDPLERLRSRPRLQRWIQSIPAVVVSLLWLADGPFSARLHTGRGLEGWLSDELPGWLALAGVVGLTYLATRVWGRALVAPVETEREAPKGPGEIVFSAVAVTARTRTVVGSFAAATVAMVGLTLTVPSDPRFGWALAAYVLTALSAPFFFQRASRIAVGIDGVWVRDASHPRFFAYRDLDEARPRGADLELVAGGRAVLRLQMHGDDAGRRDEVLARVNEAIARSRESTSRAAGMLVQALPAQHLASSARGGEGYRVPSVSRDQLWEVVEGQASDAQARTAAAKVLAIQLDEGERARLRVAAGQCAEPRLRVALEALAGEAERDAEVAVAEHLQPSRTARTRVVNPDDRG
jgi:hypothetical protein